MLQIRQLGPNDAAALLGLLRVAATDEPSAFVTSPEDDFVASAKTVRAYLEQAPDKTAFGAFERDLVGMLWFSRETRTKLAHKAVLWRAFVRAESRGRGVGSKLLQAAIEHARTSRGLAAIRLCVSERSPGARKLYERAGFQAWGTEPDAFRVDGEAVRLHYMTLWLE